MARFTVEFMVHSCHEYISKLLFESELDLLRYCNIDNLTSILMQNKLKIAAHAPHVIKKGKLTKSWQIVVICQIRLSFSPPKYFTVR